MWDRNFHHIAGVSISSTAYVAVADWTDPTAHKGRLVVVSWDGRSMLDHELGGLPVGPAIDPLGSLACCQVNRPYSRGCDPFKLCELLVFDVPLGKVLFSSSETDPEISYIERIEDNIVILAGDRNLVFDPTGKLLHKEMKVREQPKAPAMRGPTPEHEALLRRLGISIKVTSSK